ncbi:MAG: hypothetical protein DI585_02055 [Pseudomonas fluorescens]|nr:MAG: hypothetical protein DI585_02055 [Pseudomonas fluorescens]
MKPDLPFKPNLRRPSQQLRNLNATLKAKPPSAAGTWLFVYGLLAKRPPFKYVHAKPFTLLGWHREFHLADPLNRGTPTSPGLTLGLIPGGECPGIAYLLSDTETHQSLIPVWEQEMLLPFYAPQWIQHDGHMLLTMTTDLASPALWTGLSLTETAALLGTRQGTQGTNYEYLTDVIQAFEAAHQHDPYLQNLNRHIHGT